METVVLVVLLAAAIVSHIRFRRAALRFARIEDDLHFMGMELSYVADSSCDVCDDVRWLEDDVIRSLADLENRLEDRLEELDVHSHA